MLRYRTDEIYIPNCQYKQSVPLSCLCRAIFFPFMAHRFVLPLHYFEDGNTVSSHEQHYLSKTNHSSADRKYEFDLIRWLITEHS